MGNKSRIAGWVLSALCCLFLIFGSAVGKFLEWPGKQEMFDHLGYSVDTMMKIGVLEIVVTLLTLVPGVSFLGMLLLTAYLGGATATHVRVGDPFFFPPILGAVAWFAYFLRNPQLRSLIFNPSIK